MRRFLKFLAASPRPASNVQAENGLVACTEPGDKVGDYLPSAIGELGAAKVLERY
jgi:hypothetical protein